MQQDGRYVLGERTRVEEMGESLVVVAVVVAVVVVVVFVGFFLCLMVIHEGSSTISSSMKLKCILPSLFGSALLTCCPLGLPPGRRC